MQTFIRYMSGIITKITRIVTNQINKLPPQDIETGPRLIEVVVQKH